MEKIIIEGGVKLNGTVKISGAKNAALPILLSSILTDKENKIHNVPNLKDVDTTCQLLKGAGVKVERSENGQVIVDASRINNTEASYDLVRTMRASVMVLGPLLARLGKAKVSLPGGCAIGARPINLHLKGFEALGANIKLEHGYVVAEAKRLKGNRIYFDIVTVTGTENIMMAGVLAEGKTIIENAAREPEVVNLANTLNSMGASIKETGTFMIAAAITGGDVEIINCIPEYIEPVIIKLTEAGMKIDIGKDFIRVKGNGKIE